MIKFPAWPHCSSRRPLATGPRAWKQNPWPSTITPPSAVGKRVGQVGLSAACTAREVVDAGGSVCEAKLRQAVRRRAWMAASEVARPSGICVLASAAAGAKRRKSSCRSWGEATARYAATSSLVTARGTGSSTSRSRRTTALNGFLSRLRVEEGVSTDPTEVEWASGVMGVENVDRERAIEVSASVVGVPGDEGEVV